CEQDCYYPTSIGRRRLLGDTRLAHDLSPLKRNCHAITSQDISGRISVFPVFTARDGNSMLQGGNKQGAVQLSPGWRARSFLPIQRTNDFSFTTPVGAHSVKDSKGWV